DSGRPGALRVVRYEPVDRGEHVVALGLLAETPELGGIFVIDIPTSVEHQRTAVTGGSARSRKAPRSEPDRQALLHRWRDHADVLDVIELPREGERFSAQRLQEDCHGFVHDPSAFVTVDSVARELLDAVAEPRAQLEAPA